MKHHYPDIIELSRDLERARDPGDSAPMIPPPQWWDENGTPRFADHHPDLCPDIYADEVALLRVACQACEKEFLVQMSNSRMTSAVKMVRTGAFGPVAAALEEALDRWESYYEDQRTSGQPMEDPRAAELRADLLARRRAKPLTLSDVVRDGTIHYGDPPHTECCAAGPTMNCRDLAVVEFWERGSTMESLNGMRWHRISSLEIALPDAGDPDYDQCRKPIGDGVWCRRPERHDGEHGTEPK